MEFIEKLNETMDYFIEEAEKIDLVPEAKHRKAFVITVKKDLEEINIYIDERSRLDINMKEVKSRYCSIDCKGLSIVFSNEKLVEIEVRDLNLWGIDLDKWLREVSEKMYDYVKKQEVIQAENLGLHNE